MNDVARKLAEPFAPEIVSWRVGSVSAEKKRGMALAFVDARDVMNRLDDACGPFGWMTEHSALGTRTMCRLSIRDPETGEWISRTDGCGDTDYEAEKGSFSDSLKRVAVTFGVGRYLYDVDAPWVEVEQRGKTWVIAASELPKLRLRLPRPGKPADARPASAPPRAAQPSTPPQAPTSGHLPANPAEPPHITAARAEQRAHFWTRETYAIDPEVIQGGLANWSGEMLAQAETAPSLDAYLKMEEDCRPHFDTWAAAMQKPVVDLFCRKLGAIHDRLSKAEGGRAA
jgi:hypothetical protein